MLKVHENISRLHKSQGWTQSDLAQRLGTLQIVRLENLYEELSSNEQRVILKRVEVLAER